MGLELVNRLFTPSTVMWSAAGVALALLVLTRPVADIMTSGRRDGTMRGLKVFLYLLLFLEVALPALLLVTGEGGTTPATGLYVLFFPLFCYYLGKGIGRRQGRQAVTELVGLDSFDNIEDAQDRLFESRMRFPRREEVIESIGALSKAADKANQQPPAVKNAEAGSGDTNEDDDIFEVAVEEVPK